MPLVQYLLSRGANPNAQNIAERTTPLHDACTVGNLQVVKILVEAGANLELKRKEGVTPLYYAVYHRHFPIVKYLVSKGAKVNVTQNVRNQFKVTI